MRSSAAAATVSGLLVGLQRRVKMTRPAVNISQSRLPLFLLAGFLLLVQLPIAITRAFVVKSSCFAMIRFGNFACIMVASITLFPIVVPRAIGNGSRKYRAQQFWETLFCASYCLAAIFAHVHDTLTPHDEVLISSLTNHESFPRVAQTVLLMTPLTLMVVFPAHRVCTVLVLIFSYGTLLACSLVSTNASTAPLQQVHGFFFSAIVCAASNGNRHLRENAVSELTPKVEPESVRGTVVSVAAEASAHDLVANAAHDLKTPLSSFMMGVEHIGAMLRDCTLHLESSPQANVPKLFGTLAAIGDSIDRMHTTNIFMVMGINRLQDYAKARRGLQLVPQNDTINLVEALSLPLNCMIDIQTTVQIVLEELPTGLCPFIITDRHWLQENLLCLLSNAAKYSNGGQVVVRVLLENEGREASARSNGAITGDGVESAAVSTAQMSLIRGFTSRVVPLDVTFSSLTLSPRPPPLVRTISTRSAESEAPAMVALRFEVEDHGVGMSDQARESLFSPFRQAQRMAGGTGLGLFSLSQRVEALHGKCGVERRRDGQQGSRFWFTIPYRADHNVASALPLLRGYESGAASPGFEHRNMSEATTSIPMPTGTVHGLTINSATEGTATLRTLSSWADSPRSTARTTAVCSPSPLRISVNRSAVSTPTARVTAENSSPMVHGAMCTIGSHDTSLSPFAAPSVLADISVLLVEDSQVVSSMTVSMLRRMGFQVKVATNGGLALEAIEAALCSMPLECDCQPRAAFDVILMDLQMPVMDGLEATRRLRNWESNRCTPSGLRLAQSVRHVVVGLSANNEQDVERDIQKAGFDSFIPKPLSQKALLDCLARLGVNIRHET